jgi:hypothetical protein
MKKYRYYIGIDTGVNTGLAIWDRHEKKFIQVKSMAIHLAMATASVWLKEDSFFRVEDARKRKWFGNAGRGKLQGAGSIKRDGKMWEDFLTDIKANFEMVAPKDNKTKVRADFFRKITGWKETTNEHSRDAAMLVFAL